MKIVNSSSNPIRVIISFTVYIPPLKTATIYSNSLRNIVTSVIAAKPLIETELTNLKGISYNGITRTEQGKGTAAGEKFIQNLTHTNMRVGIDELITIPRHTFITYPEAMMGVEIVNDPARKKYVLFDETVEYREPGGSRLVSVGMKLPSDWSMKPPIYGGYKIRSVFDPVYRSCSDICYSSSVDMF